MSDMYRVVIRYRGGAKTEHVVPDDRAREIEEEFEWNPDVVQITSTPQKP